VAGWGVAQRRKRLEQFVMLGFIDIGMSIDRNIAYVVGRIARIARRVLDCVLNAWLARENVCAGAAYLWGLHRECCAIESSCCVVEKQKQLRAGR